MDVITATLPLDRIRPHPQNYQVHPPGQITELRESLRCFGYVRTVVVQANGDDSYTFVAGHGIGEAARLEGYTELECRVIPEDWPPARVLAYLVADNRLAGKALVDETQLAAVLADIQAYEQELVTSSGYSDEEVAALLESTALPEEWPDYDEEIAGDVEFIQCPECGHRWPK